MFFSDDLPVPVMSTGEGVPFQLPGAAAGTSSTVAAAAALPPKPTRKRAGAAAAAAAATGTEEASSSNLGVKKTTTRKPRTLKTVGAAAASSGDEKETAQPAVATVSRRPRATAAAAAAPPASTLIRDDLAPASLVVSSSSLPLPKVKMVVAAAEPRQPPVASMAAPPLSPSSSPKKVKTSFGGGKVLSFDEWTALLPTPAPATSADPMSYQTEWLGSFQRYIYVVLASVYTDDRVRSMAVESDMLRIWRRAFTDRSFASDNYETLETIGDKALSVAFAKYVYAKKPNVTPRELSNFIMYYMSNRFQPVISADLKMDSWILFGKEVAKERVSATTKSIKEDIFEAFCGALEAVATLVHAKLVERGEYEVAALHAPSGGDALRRFVETLFNHYGLNDKFSRNAAKTTIGEIGTIFGLRTRNVYFSSGASGYSVVVPEDLAVALEATEGVSSPLPRVLVSGYPSEEEAANAALEVLESYGIDDRWLATRREEKGLDFIVASVRDALVSLTKAYYPKLVFEIPISSKSADGSFTMILTGVTQTDQKNVLASGRGTSVTELKTRLANEVIQKMS